MPVENVNQSRIYTLDWKKESLTWLVDGKPLRTLFRANSTSPMVCLVFLIFRLLLENGGILKLHPRSRSLSGMVVRVAIKEPALGLVGQSTGDLRLNFLQLTSLLIFSVMMLRISQ